MRTSYRPYHLLPKDNPATSERIIQEKQALAEQRQVEDNERRGRDETDRKQAGSEAAELVERAAKEVLSLFCFVFIIIL